MRFGGVLEHDLASASGIVDVTEISRSCLLLVPAATAYQVVIDVERYADFVPACKKVQVLERRREDAQVEWVEAQVTVGKAGAEYVFVTENKCVANEQVEVNLKQGPFKRLHGVWTFKALGDKGCRVDLTLDFEATSLLSGLLDGMAQKVADSMVDAFSRRISDAPSHGN